MPDPDWDSEEESAPPFEIKDILYAIVRSRLWIIAFALIGGVVGLVVAASQPNEFRSQAKLLLRVGASEAFLPEDILDLEFDTGRGTKPTIYDELHLLADEAIYARVVDQVGARRILSIPDPTRHDNEGTPLPKRYFHRLQSKLFRTLRVPDVTEGPGADLDATFKIYRNTTIDSTRNSNVLIVNHTANSPKLAKETCDAIVAQCIERHREQYSLLPFLEDNRQQVDDAEKSYEVEKTNYFAHLDDCGLVRLDDQLTELLTQAEKTKTDLFDARLRRKEIDIELGERRKQLDTTEPNLIELVPAIMQANPEYEAKLKAKEEALLRRQTLDIDSSMTAKKIEQMRVSIDERVAELDKELAETAPRVVLEPEKPVEKPNPEFVTLHTQIEDLEIEDKALVTRIGELENLESRQADRRGLILNCQKTHEKMQASIDRKGSEHTKLTEVFTGLEAQATLYSKSHTNLQVLKAASFPLEKDGPRRSVLVLMGLVGGIVVGTGFGVLRHFLDQKLRYPHMVDRALGVPVLAVVSESGNLRSLSRLA